jgi:small subunit ribosomal protein S13
MAEKQKQKQENKNEKVDKSQEKKGRPVEEESEVLVRILSYDLPGSRNIYSGLTRIKGVSWAISNIVCLRLGLAKNKKVLELTKEEIARIEELLKNLEIPEFMKNRRNDFQTGESSHYLSSDLDIKREFDIKRLKEIKSYKGFRHASKLPVRGQRTKSHFRKKAKAMGIKTKKKAA